MIHVEEHNHKYLRSVPDIEEVLTWAAPDAYIAGGAARYAILGDNAPQPTDIDIWLFAPHQAGYVPPKLWKSMEKAGYQCSKVSRVANTYSYDIWGWRDTSIRKLPLQVVMKHCTTPPALLQTFSFTTERFAIWKEGKKIMTAYDDGAILDTKNKVIHIKDITNPVMSIARVVKYAHKGYSISLVEIQKILDAWAAMTPEQKEKAKGHEGVYEAFADLTKKGSDDGEHTDLPAP